MKKRIPPLIIEHYEALENLHLISVVEFNRQEYTCIIDNITHNEVKAFVLDKTVARDIIPIPELISEAIYWFYNASDKHQFSIQLAQKGMTHLIVPIYRSFNIGNVSRVVGKVFHYPELAKAKVKRKRIIPIPEGVEIHLKRLQN